MTSLDNFINDAIHTAIVNNILNIYRDTIRNVRNPNRLPNNLSRSPLGLGTTSFTNISSRYYNNPPQGGYVVNEEHEYIFPDNDDLSAMIFLDVATRFGSPGSDNGFLEKYKIQRKNKIKQIGKYKKIKENDQLINDECSICIENFCCGEYQRTLVCNHVFHKKCIDKWFKKDKNECPICRRVIIDSE
jgi:hypothetical protein